MADDNYKSRTEEYLSEAELYILGQWFIPGNSRTEIIPHFLHGAMMMCKDDLFYLELETIYDLAITRADEFHREEHRESI